MKTASFAGYKGTGRISIAVGRPRGIKRTDYAVYPALAPERSWLKLPHAAYLPLYRDRLAGLDAQEVWDELHALVPGAEPILLCFEKPPLTADNWCHRRMVATWFQQELGHEVAELGQEAQGPRAAAKAMRQPRRDAANGRLMNRPGYVSPSSRGLHQAVTLEEFQELCERHYGALDAWWLAQGKGAGRDAGTPDDDINLARRQVRAGWKRMRPVERALALQRRMISATLVGDIKVED